MTKREALTIFVYTMILTFVAGLILVLPGGPLVLIAIIAGVLLAYSLMWWQDRRDRF